MIFFSFWISESKWKEGTTLLGTVKPVTPVTSTTKQQHPPSPTPKKKFIFKKEKQSNTKEISLS